MSKARNAWVVRLLDVTPSTIAPQQPTGAVTYARSRLAWLATRKWVDAEVDDLTLHTGSVIPISSWRTEATVELRIVLGTRACFANRDMALHIGFARVARGRDSEW